MKCPKCGSTDFSCVMTTYDSAFWDEDKQKLMIIQSEPEPLYAKNLRQIYDKIICQECDHEFNWEQLKDIDWEFE